MLARQIQSIDHESVVPNLMVWTRIAIRIEILCTIQSQTTEAWGAWDIKADPSQLFHFSKGIGYVQTPNEAERHSCQS